MSIYAIGDLHLSFSVDKPMDVFGQDWANHAERIKANWESLVEPEDTVIIAGDISWALKYEDALVDLEWIHNLPGKKVLIRGNHDLWWSGINKLNNLYEDMTFLQNTHYECTDSFSSDTSSEQLDPLKENENTGKIAICGSRGWTDPSDSDFNEDDEKIYKRELLRMEMSLESAIKAQCEKIIVAIHYPPAISNNMNDILNKNSMSDFTTLFEKYPVKKVIYGHLHGEVARRKGITGTHNGIEYQLVAADAVEFTPVNVDI